MASDFEVSISMPKSSCGYRFWIPKKYPMVQNKEDCLCWTMRSWGPVEENGKKGAISEDGPDSNVPGKRKCIPLPPEVTSESEKSRFLRFNETPPHNALRPGSI
ncbi:hypothetical protein TNIN_234061 [Trichonephila inaurata madagascariensis]|uniref:Uncharacterized protein n=1 Tax=Trichonephila inaurata madagascariensis TaxID=2747483 RepID=A0A8X6X7L7_9ARAC|nr:hypothetical protein TNIN_234061 [Trichonephila inaurata madagascariensis]